MLHDSGLAIHKGKGVYSKTWVISHFNSGKSVLSYIKLKKEVDLYLERLIEICENWNFTLEEFDESDCKTYLKREVDKIQREVLKGA